MDRYVSRLLVLHYLVIAYFSNAVNVARFSYSYFCSVRSSAALTGSTGQGTIHLLLDRYRCAEDFWSVETSDWSYQGKSELRLASASLTEVLQGMSKQQIAYTNVARAMPHLPPPARRYQLRTTTSRTKRVEENVWTYYLPVSLEDWRFTGFLGRNSRRLEELEGAWHAEGGKVLGLDCDVAPIADATLLDDDDAASSSQQPSQQSGVAQQEHSQAVTARRPAHTATSLRAVTTSRPARAVTSLRARIQDDDDRVDMGEEVDETSETTGGAVEASQPSSEDEEDSPDDDSDTITVAPLRPRRRGR